MTSFSCPEAYSPFLSLKSDPLTEVEITLVNEEGSKDGAPDLLT